MLQKPLGTGELIITLLGDGLAPSCKNAAIESSGRDTSLEKDRLQGHRRSWQVRRSFFFFFTTCLTVPNVNIHIAVVIVITHIFTAVIPRVPVRLLSTFPILLHKIFFEERSSKQNERNPNYYPWWKTKREKSVEGSVAPWRGGKDQTWFNLLQKSRFISVGVPWTCCPFMSSAPSLTPGSVRYKAPCSRLLLSWVMRRSISLGRLLPMTLLISKFAVT